MVLLAAAVVGGCASRERTVVEQLGEVGQVKTLTIGGGEQTVRETLKQALREEGWRIVRFGRLEDREGRISGAETVSGEGVFVAHYLYLNALRSRFKAEDGEQMFVCEIELFGTQPDRRIIKFTSRGTLGAVVSRFMAALAEADPVRVTQPINDITNAK